jgi:hypothetical protein
MQTFQNLSEFEAIIPTLDTVELKPVSVDGSPVDEDISSYVAVWNKTRNQIENVVPRSHSALIQHKEVFNAFARVVKEKDLEINGVVKNFGGHVVVEALFDGLNINDGSKGGVNMGVRLENNYERRGPSFKGTEFGHRVRCQNGMVLWGGEISRITKRHTKVAEIEKGLLEFVQSVISNQGRVNSIIENARNDVFSDFAEARKVLIGEIASKKIRDKVAELFETKDNITRYTLYNALTQYATREVASEAARMRVHRIAQRILTKPRTELKHGKGDV